jgi:hypothetical protein
MKKMNRSMLGLLGMLFLLNLFCVSSVMPCYAEEKLFPLDSTLSVYMGGSVSMSGDTAVAGAPYSSSTGAAYVFQYDGTEWVEVARLTADVPAMGDLFGSSVAVNGKTIVVGSPYSGNKGAAYVFKYEGTEWVQAAMLTADPAYAGANFGAAVSMSGDTIVIGAPYSGSSGAVYVFKYDGAGWVQVKRLIATDIADYGAFGDSVSIDGDRILVGAPGDAEHAGSAYVFTYNGTDWVQTPKLTAEGDAAEYELFGESVSISGDTVAVGAIFDDGNAGSAYVFRYDGARWPRVAKLSVAGAEGSDGIGTSVFTDGDRVLVGAPGDDYSTGAAYLFKDDGAGWSQVAKLTATDAYYGDSFGTSVFIDGDRTLIGAPGDENYIGAAYVFTFERKPDLEILEIEVDIKPGSDSNPLNPKSKGVLPVAILGSPTFDVMTIDPETIRLSREGIEGEVAPIRKSYGDVATSLKTPMAGCLELEGDGYMDLKLKFATQQLVEVLKLREVAGQSVQLTLTGTLKEEFGGTPIEGQDYVKVLKTGKKADKKPHPGPKK